MRDLLRLAEVKMWSIMYQPRTTKWKNINGYVKINVFIFESMKGDKLETNRIPRTDNMGHIIVLSCLHIYHELGFTSGLWTAEPHILSPLTKNLALEKPNGHTIIVLT